jgi:hypothetical protein
VKLKVRVPPYFSDGTRTVKDLTLFIMDIAIVTTDIITTSRTPKRASLFFLSQLPSPPLPSILPSLLLSSP